MAQLVARWASDRGTQLRHRTSHVGIAILLMYCNIDKPGTAVPTAIQFLVMNRRGLIFELLRRVALLKPWNCQKCLHY